MRREVRNCLVKQFDSTLVSIFRGDLNYLTNIISLDD